ncbi:MAG: acyltransferase family protein [Clostridia bacterium]|nr:acyltransferase family protein [Clostridia bacterium]
MIYKQRSFPAIDVAKVVMAVAVVIIHKPLFLQDYPNYLLSNVLCDVAVPFFFAAASFLFFRKLGRETERPVTVWLRYEKRLLVLYLLYTIIYLPCIFVKNHTGYYSEITIGSIFGESLLLIKKFFWTASFAHLWYMNTLILSIAILFGLSRIVKNKWVILGIGTAAFAAITLLWFFMYGQVAPKGIMPIVYSVMKRGLLCCCLGYFAAQTDDTVPKWEKALCPVLWIAILICGIMSYGRESLFWENARLLLTFLCAYGTLRVCIGSNLQPRPVYGILRRYSTLVYFLHLLLMSEGWAFLCRHVGIQDPGAHPFLYFCVTLFLAVAEATIILRLQKKERFDFLKYLY